MAADGELNGSWWGWGYSPRPEKSALSGWWFGTCFIVPYIAKMMIPTD
jgi:hypothetical protein